MKFIFMAAILLSVSSHANAMEKLFSNGNEFLAQCQNGQRNDLCIGYVVGAFAVMQETGAGDKASFVLRNDDRRDVPLRSFCAPAQITLGQAFDLVVKHVEDTPKDRHFGMALLIYEAFLIAYPCD